MSSPKKHMHRFFIPPELLPNLAPLTEARSNSIVLPKDLAHQIRDVIRLNVGEQLVLFDNSGGEILATVAKISKTAVEVHLLERRPGNSEPAIRIILCQGLLKSARFEWILEKGTELGVSVFSPILCRRSMAGLEGTGSTKIQRWQRIIQEAAEQSGRSRLPELLPIRPLLHALNDIPPNAIAIMLWEEEKTNTLRNVMTTLHTPNGNVGATLAVARPSTLGNLRASTPDEPSTPAEPSTLGNLRASPPAEPSAPTHSPHTSTPPNSTQPSISHPPTTIILFIGPEGGLTTEEVFQAQQHGVQIVSLGSRILRAETAALVAVANVMYELEQ